MAAPVADTGTEVIVEAKKEKQDNVETQVQTPPAQLRDIGNIVMKNKTGLFSSNIFCKEVLEAMSQELQQQSDKGTARAVPAEKSTRCRASKKPQRNVECISLDDSSCEGSSSSLCSSPLRTSPSPDLLPMPVQHSSKTLKILEDLEKLTSARDDSCIISDDSLDDLLCLDDTFDDTMLVMVQSDKKLFKYHMKLDETFEGIFMQLSKEFDVSPSKILLTLKDGTVQMQDTPTTLNMSARDILGCIVKKFASGCASVVAREDLISLRFQCSNKRTQHTVEVGKGQPLVEGLKTFAEKISTDLSRLVVKFDGDKVNPSETPDDLGIEDGDCIDVVIRP